MESDAIVQSDTTRLIDGHGDNPQATAPVLTPAGVASHAGHRAANTRPDHDTSVNDAAWGRNHGQSSAVNTCRCTSRGRHTAAYVIVALLLLGGGVYLYLVSRYYRNSSPPGVTRPVCTLGMFANDTHAFWACNGLDAMQNNWFPSPIAGLFTYQAWNGFDGFWQNGLMIETLSNYIIYTKSKRYSRTLRASMRSLQQLTSAYQPMPSCDDELWYGLSYARAYEALNDNEFLRRSENIMNWAWSTCWDTTWKCHGGLWFDSSKRYKGTITNVEGLQLAAKLYRLTGNKNYLDKIRHLRDYLMSNDIISADFLVSDAIDNDSCAPNGYTSYTYESGTAIGAFVELFLALSHHVYLEKAHRIAQSNIKHLSYNGILTESCDNSSSCWSSKDARAFKAIFVRNLRYLINHSNQSLAVLYTNYLHHNAKSLLSNCTCYAEAHVTEACHLVFLDGAPYNTPRSPVFTENWHGPFNFSTPIEHLSGLELLIASINTTTVCTGEHCDYDPELPDIERLTCDPDPCPKGHQCCSWGRHYHTCCTPDQNCINGGCY